MTFNPYKFKSMQEKMFAEGKIYAEVRMREDENSKKYCGNGIVAKYKKHNGECVYLMTQEVVEEMLRYLLITHEACENIYWWEQKNGFPDGITKKEKALNYFVQSLKPDNDVLESIVKCYKGTPMLSFYRDTKAQEEQEAFENERKKVQDLWGF